MESAAETAANLGSYGISRPFLMGAAIAPACGVKVRDLKAAIVSSDTRRNRAS